nr:reverse transcriptase domain-containing protein [Tanacetum cinerariifolium]
MYHRGLVIVFILPYLCVALRAYCVDGVFVGLRTEDPLHHVKNYLSIVDSIQANGAIRDTSRLRFFYLSLKGKVIEVHLISLPLLTNEEAWTQIKEYVQYQDDLWDEPSPSLKGSSILEEMQPTLRGRLKRAYKKITFLEVTTQKVYLSEGDIYDDPSLLRFYQNSDTSPWGNNKRKEKGEDGPEWTHAKPPFPTLPHATTNSSTEGKTKKENPKDTEKGTMPELVPHSPILYQPSRTSDPLFPSRIKKQNKDDEDERLLSIFKQIQINLPFLEAMIHMPKGAMVLKYLLSHKEKLKKTATSVILRRLTRAEIRDLFPEEQIMEISNKNYESWYADYANYLASQVLPFRSTSQEKQKFFSDLRHYFWDEPFLFTQCVDRIIRRCVAGDVAAQILKQCNSRPFGGHHGIATTARKVFEAGLYWLHVFRDALELVQVCDACQRARNISSKDEAP